jgi:predicted permease
MFITKLVFGVAAVLGVLVVVAGALNNTGILGLPTNSVLVHVDGYLMVIFLSAFA